MTDQANLLPGDSVNWVRGDEIVPATVYGVNEKRVTIKIERDEKIYLKSIDPKNLRLVYGGRRRAEQQVAPDWIRTNARHSP